MSTNQTANENPQSILDLSSTAITSVRLDISTKCQLKCPSCPTGAQEGKNTLIGWGTLKFEDFKGFVDSNPSIREIEISNWGEIFLNRDFLAIMEYAHARNVKLNALNGVNFNTVPEKVAEGLVKYEFERFRVSIDGAHADTYSRFRRNGNFDRVIKNIKTINRYKEQYGSPYPHMLWVFIEFDYNQHEIPEARAMAESLGMSFLVADNFDLTYHPISKKWADLNENERSNKRAINLATLEAWKNDEQQSTTVEDKGAPETEETIPDHPKSNVANDPVTESPAPVEVKVPVEATTPVEVQATAEAEVPVAVEADKPEVQNVDQSSNAVEAAGDEVPEGELHVYTPCHQLWTNPQINFDGTMLGCCHNTNYGSFGNVFEEGLESVLTGDTFTYAKKMVVGEVPERADIPCTGCFFYKTVKVDNAFSSVRRHIEKEIEKAQKQAKRLDQQSASKS